MPTPMKQQGSEEVIVPLTAPSTPTPVPAFEHLPLSEVAELFQQGKITAGQLRELLEAKKALQSALESEKAEREKRAAQLQALENIKREEAVQLIRQQMCSHKKPNGMPSIMGQRESHGIAVLICLNCQKLFSFDTLPPDLAANIDYDNIGGY